MHPLYSGRGRVHHKRAKADRQHSPEFAEFNNYDPEVNPLLADQVCATPYIALQERSLRASPGELIAETGRCRPYLASIRNLAEALRP